MVYILPNLQRTYVTIQVPVKSVGSTETMIQKLNRLELIVQFCFRDH